MKVLELSPRSVYSGGRVGGDCKRNSVKLLDNLPLSDALVSIFDDCSL